MANDARSNQCTGNTAPFQHGQSLRHARVCAQSLQLAREWRALVSRSQCRGDRQARLDVGSDSFAPCPAHPQTTGGGTSIAHWNQAETPSERGVDVRGGQHLLMPSRVPVAKVRRLFLWIAIVAFFASACANRSSLTFPASPAPQTAAPPVVASTAAVPQSTASQAPATPSQTSPSPGFSWSVSG